MHVVPRIHISSDTGSITERPAGDVRAKEAALRDLAGADPRIRVETRLLEGEVANEILRTAEESKCDLIVLGTHGRVALGQLLVGSVAEPVMRGAPCIVLTVRTALPVEPVYMESLSEDQPTVVKSPPVQPRATSKANPKRREKQAAHADRVPRADMDTAC